jgi:hypothetical protein
MIWSGLKLNEQIENKSPVSISNSPDDIIFSFPQVIGDITSVTTLKSGKVTICCKAGIQKSFYQISNHLRMAE